MSQPAKTPKQIKIRVPPFIGSIITHLLTTATVKTGATVSPSPALNLTRRTLLYFKSVGCVGCDELDMFIGRLASASGLDLRVIDARRSEMPEHAYGDQLLLDKDGSIGRAYGIRIFPTLVLTTSAGKIEKVIAGASSKEESIRAGLGLN
jgi:hypothetical protein